MRAAFKIAMLTWTRSLVDNVEKPNNFASERRGAALICPSKPRVLREILRVGWGGGGCFYFCREQHGGE